MSRPTQVTIDLTALQHNLQIVKNLAPQSAVLAMVKSNGYGHGLRQIGLALEKNVAALGVACLEEGMELRDAGVKNDIVLLEGLFSAEELTQADVLDFTLVVHHFDQIDILEQQAVNRSLNVWLKIDTGMHRLGFAPKDVMIAYQRLMKCSSVKKPIGLMTHFSESDSANKTITLRQINQFHDLTRDLTGPRSLANSGGILAFPESHADWVRPGIMLYGASPFANRTGCEHHLQPVMTLTSELIALHDLPKGERVSYGGTWICPEEMKIGVVAVGYGDGYPRHAKNGTPVLVNGKEVPLIGRVSMDMIMVDLRRQPDAKVGDPAVLWGKNLPVEIIAEHSDTIGYELLTRIAQRVRVKVINSAASLLS